MFPYIPFRTFQNEYLGSLVIIFIPGVSQNYYKNQTLGPHKSGLREPILLVHGNSGHNLLRISRARFLGKKSSLMHFENAHFCQNPGSEATLAF